MSISIVISLRDRAVDTIVRLVQSIQKNTKSKHEIIISDSGSRSEIENSLQRIASQMRLKYVRSETTGLPWSKGHAINNGVRAAMNRYIGLIDADMILCDPAFDYILDKIEENEAYFLEAIYYRSRFDKKGFVNRGGGCSVISIDWFKRLNGFDESIEYWGGEDSDWLCRLRKSSVNICWLTADNFRLIHPYHRTASSSVHLPQNVRWETVAKEMTNSYTPYLNVLWGTCLSMKDRPILRFVNESARDIHAVYLEPSSFSDRFDEITECLRQKGFIEVNLGPRIIQRKLHALNGWYRRMLRIFQAFALDITPMINSNLEMFLLARKVWGNTLSDYYISEDFQKVYLLSL